MLPSARSFDLMVTILVLSNRTWVMPSVRWLALIPFTQIWYLRLSSVVVAVAVMLRRLVLALVTIWAPFTCPASSVRLSMPPTPRELARPRLLCPSSMAVLL